MSTSLESRNKVASSESRSIDISVRGKWHKTPAFEANGQTIAITGRWIKIAALHDEEWLEQELLNPEGAVRKLREDRNLPRADLLTFAQKIPSVMPRYGYTMEWESVAVARTGSFKGWWESLPQESRKNVRRAEKRGVVISVQPFSDELVRGIETIQNESPIRQGRRYPHFGKSFEQVKKDHSGLLDRSSFICAHCEGQLVGFLKLVYRGDIASVLQLNSLFAAYDKRPSNALLAKAVELCEARGLSHLTYGLFNYGNKGDNSLREFKSRNGFEEMLTPRYYLPLTAWGKLCVRGRLYRGVHDILPPFAIAAVLAARTKWRQLIASK